MITMTELPTTNNHCELKQGLGVVSILKPITFRLENRYIRHIRHIHLAEFFFFLIGQQSEIPSYL